MSKIQVVVDKVRTGYQTESIIRDQVKKGKSNIFSEASRGKIKEFGNVELFEFGEISKTVQCTACIKYTPEGLFYCTCDVCLMPTPE